MEPKVAILANFRIQTRQYLDALDRETELTPATIKRRALVFNRLHRYLEGQELHDKPRHLNVEMMLGFEKWLMDSEGLGRKAAGDSMICVRNFYKWMHWLDLVDENPLEYLTRIRRRVRTPKRLMTQYQPPQHWDDQKEGE